MASDDSCHKLVVRNLPDNVTDDDMILFFESRFCPDGGDVDSIEMLPDGTAIVTFAESEVVSRLLKRKTVTFQDVSLTFQSLENEKVDDKGSPSDSNDDGDNDEGGSCNSHDSKDSEEENVSNFDTKSNNDKSESNEGDDDYSDEETGSGDNTRKIDFSIGGENYSLDEHKTVDEHRSELTVENIEQHNSDHDHSNPVKDESSDEFCSLGENESHFETHNAEASTDVQKEHINLSPLKDSGFNNVGNVSEKDKENSFKEEKNDDLSKQEQTSAEHKGKPVLLEEKLEDRVAISKEVCKDNTTLPTEINKGEMTLPSEKVKLLMMLSDAKVLSEGFMQSVCNIDAENGKIFLAGTKEDVMNAKLELYEKANIMSDFRVEMQKPTSELLFTDRGAQWLEGEFQKRKISAVLYQKHGNTRIVALDDDDYDNATKVLQEILADKVIPFQDDHLEYLGSAGWKRLVEEFSAKEIIHISVDFNSKEIIIEGNAGSVTAISENILALLKTNSKVTKSIELRKGSVRLLKEHRNTVTKTVTDALKRFGDQKVEFEFKETSIELTGAREAVEEASRVIGEEYVSSIQHVHYDVRQSGVTAEAFTTKDSFGEDIIESLEMKHKCVIEVREGDPVSRNADGARMLPDRKAGVTSEPVGIFDNVMAAVSSYVVNPILSGVASAWDPKPDPSLPTKTNIAKIASNITVQTGSLVDFQADVLVNPVAHSTSKLVKAGAVAKSFYKKGMDALQQEFEEVGSPRDFGRGISVTSNASGVFPCKQIYHVPIRHCRNSQSVELLRQLIEGCLKQAEGQNMTSIAFPTIGCGKLGYNLKDVVRCFNEAALNSKLQVYVIGYEQATCDAFKSYLTQPILNRPNESPPQTVEAAQPEPVPRPVTQVKPVTSRPSTSTTLPSMQKAVVFHIVALDGKTAEKAREALVRKLSDSVVDAKVESEAIASLSDDMINTIRKIPSASEIDLDIDKQNKTIRLGGHHVAVHKTKAAIDRLLAEEERNRNDLQYIKSTVGVAAYLARLAAMENLQLPKYWTHYKRYDEGDTGPVETPLPAGTELYKAVESMVMGTWEAAKVGQGHDAVSLSHSNIVIKNISVIENLNQFRCYKSQLKNLSYRASRNQFKLITSLQGEAEIATKSLPGVNYLYDNLVSEVNEYYLLHGSSHQKTIIKSGIDFRFSADRVLFGKGAYFTEKSIKADQYADPKDSRKPNGEKLYMFVARVLLGEPHLCQKPYSYKKAPCSDASCQSESCESNHLPCDSVIGTHRNATVGTARLLFREFIIYHTDQCYPEFLVEYVRQ